MTGTQILIVGIIIGYLAATIIYTAVGLATGKIRL